MSMKIDLYQIGDWYARRSPVLRFTLPLVIMVAAVSFTLAYTLSRNADEQLRLLAQDNLEVRLKTVLGNLEVATEAGRRPLDHLDPLVRQLVKCQFSRDMARRETVGSVEVPVLSCDGVPASRNAVGLVAFASATGSDSFLMVRNGNAFVVVARAAGAGEMDGRSNSAATGFAPVKVGDPAYQAVISGQTWSGPLRYTEVPGTARLIPLRGSDGEVIGAFGHFRRLVDSTVGLDEILKDRPAGHLGYFFVIDNADGADRGRYIFKHPRQEGGNILKSNETVVARAGEQMLERTGGMIHTLWPAPDIPGLQEPALIAYQHVPEWGWVVAAVDFEQDYPRPVISAGRSSTWQGVWGALLITAVSLFMGRRMLRKAGIALSHGKTEDEQKAKSRRELLDRCSIDLTQRAREGRLDPVIGRDAETERCIQILLRRSKNNPVLLGEPGVGKTAIVEGVARRIVTGQVPESLRGKRVINLDIAMLVAGTKYRGEFEERLKSVLMALTEDPDIILFIDEIHVLVGAGRVEGGAMDAGNIMKPALARGELRCIGATTLGEWSYIESDPALERRFQRVMVDEPSVAAVRDILGGLRKNYADFHGVEVTDEAIAAAAELSHRYITGRFLPDKAIDLIDEAASTVKSAADTKAGKASLASVAQGIDISPGRPRVEAADVAQVVARATGIPISRLTKNQSEHLLELEPYLRRHVIGQNHVINAVVHTLRRSYVGLGRSARPLGTFLLAGPKGVGKTELVRVMAEFLFGSREALVRIDLSEYGQASAVSQLLGGSSGALGQEQAGRLTEPVRWSPYRVLLLKGIERAHPAVQEIIRQLLEEGSLVDGKGRRIDFTNTVVFIIRSTGIQETAATAAMAGHGLLLDIEERVDAVCHFAPLERPALRQIARLQTQLLGERLVSRELCLEVTEEVLDLLAESALCAGAGAHGVLHAVEAHLAEPLAELILARNPLAGTCLAARVTAGRIALEIVV